LADGGVTRVGTWADGEDLFVDECGREVVGGGGGELAPDVGCDFACHGECLVAINPSDQELNAELDHHRRALTADSEKQRHSPAEPLRRARLAFSPFEAIKEECRDERRGSWWFDLGLDLRHALRMLRRSPVLATVAVLSLRSTIFTLIDSLLLPALPVEAPEALQVFKWTRAKHPDEAVVRTMTGPLDNERGLVGDPFSCATYLQLRSHVSGWAHLGAELCAVRAGGLAETAMVQAASGNYHSLLGVRPFGGRLLLDADHAGNAPPRRWSAIATGRTAWLRTQPLSGGLCKLTTASFRLSG